MSTSEDIFDHHSRDYRTALNRGLHLTGESADYFAWKRVMMMLRLCQEASLPVERLIDFGCGTGTTLPILQEIMGAHEVIGIEPSAASRAEAARYIQSGHIRCVAPADAPEAGWADAAYCNGVFHHIPPAQRISTLREIWRLLRPGGLFFLWENNPANPGTRWVMSRIPFDRDAIMVWPREARRMGMAAGFSQLETRHTFFFPRALRMLRPLEEWMVHVPLGGQYVCVFLKN